MPTLCVLLLAVKGCDSLRFFGIGSLDFVPSEQSARIDLGESVDFILAIDVDSDGDPDLAAGIDGGIAILRNDGRGTFSPPVLFQKDIRVRFLIACDIDGDDDLDIAAAGDNLLTPDRQAVAVAFNQGDGTFEWGEIIDGGADQFQTGTLATGDLDGDGDIDLAVGDGENFEVLFYFNNGDGSFADPTVFRTFDRDQFEDIIFTSFDSIVLGDTDGDGDNDLAATGFGSVNVMRNRGDGSFSTGVPYVTGGTVDRPFVKFVTSGDLNDDDLIDLVFLTRFPQLVGTLINDGEGSFLPPTQTDLDGPSFATLADLNEDAMPDLLVLGDAGDAIYLLTNKGDGSFAALARVVQDLRGTDSIAAADFDGDGDVDLAVDSIISVTVLFNNGGVLAPIVSEPDDGIPPDDDGQDTSLPDDPKPFMFTGPINETDLSTGGDAVAGDDFNGDGFFDVAVITPAGPAVLPGNGDGTFAAPIETDFFSPIDHAVAADFDGDGILDLAVTPDLTSTVVFLTSDGDGGFVETLRVQLSDRPAGLTTADFDGDGDTDLAASLFGSQLAILLNNGAATQFEVIESETPDTFFLSAAADVDGDRDIDLVAGDSFDNEVHILVNDGHGQFTPSVVYKFREERSFVQFIASEDLDADGDDDLIIAADDLHVAINSGTDELGNPVFAEPMIIQAELASGHFLLRDLNRDGSIDLVAQGFGRNFVFANRGDGSFADPIEFEVLCCIEPFVDGDVDGDGIIDLVFASELFEQTAWARGLPFAFDPPVKFDVAREPTSITTGDWNSDGIEDLAVATSGSDAVVSLFGDGNGSFVTGEVFFTGVGPSHISSGDWDGDGDLDLAVANVGVSGFVDGSLSLHMNNGDGTYAPAVNPSLPLGTADAIEGPTSVVPADWDGDGDIDLLTTEILRTSNRREPQLTFWRNNGSGEFTAALAFSLDENVTEGLGVPAAADLDGDGDIDIAIPTGTFQQVFILVNVGAGSFEVGTRHDVGSGPQSVTAADLDGDGDIDLITANSDNSLSVLLNTVAGVFDKATTISSVRDARFVAAADIDGDGDIDLVAPNLGRDFDSRFLGDEIAILLNAGDGTFPSRAALAAEADPSVVVLLDINSDGRVDIVAANKTALTVSAYTNATVP